VWNTSVRGVGRRFFPLDERWGLDESVYSPECARQMVWLSGLLTYEEASQVLERIGHRLIPSASIWRQTQKHGRRMEAEMRRQEQQVSIERVVLASRRREEEGKKGVSMDGGMVNIRGEGWKEFKAGTVYDIQQRWERDPRTRELVQVPHGVHIGYTAVLGSPREFAPALWRLAVQYGIPHADDLSVTADGAEWIWNLTADLFPDSVQIVDWGHACEHVAQAAAALFPDRSDRSQRWYAQAQTTLFQAGAWAIAAQLEAAHLPDHAHYFRTHQRRMQYAEFREQGFPIGSGTVESAIKQFKTRLSGPGMRWSRPAAQQMLIIRSAVLEGSFDSLSYRAA
jgi:hypothetical protein